MAKKPSAKQQAHLDAINDEMNIRTRLYLNGDTFNQRVGTQFTTTSQTENYLKLWYDNACMSALEPEWCAACIRAVLGAGGAAYNGTDTQLFEAFDKWIKCVVFSEFDRCSFLVLRITTRYGTNVC
jgi:hypothetical protein